MLREARDLLSLVRCAVTGIVYRPLVKRARQRNSRRLWLYCPQPQRTAQHGWATLDFCAYCIKTSVKNFETLCKIL